MTRTVLLPTAALVAALVACEPVREAWSTGAWEYAEQVVVHEDAPAASWVLLADGGPALFDGVDLVGTLDLRLAVLAAPTAPDQEEPLTVRLRVRSAADDTVRLDVTDEVPFDAPTWLEHDLGGVFAQCTPTARCEEAWIVEVILEDPGAARVEMDAAVYLEGLYAEPPEDDLSLEILTEEEARY